MKKFLMASRFIVAALLVAFLAVAPPYLIKNLKRDPYREMLGGDRNDEGWTGIITVWHVVGFKTMQGSVTSYLEGVAAVYEKANSGIYIEVTGMSPELFYERTSRGEFPDICSVPMDMLNEFEFMPARLNLPEFAAGLNTLEAEGGALAFPYLYSGYFLLGNTMLLQEWDIPFPSAQAISKAQSGEPEELIEALNAALNARATARYGALAAPESYINDWGLNGSFGTDGDFKAGQVPFMIGDARAYGDLSRKLSNGGFTFDAAPLGGKTQQAQYIGLAASLEAERLEHASGLLSLLLEQKQQQRLTALGAMPAVKLDAAPEYTDSLLLQMYEATR